MIWLSLLPLNLRSRAVRNDLRDCQGLHRTLMCLFPETAGDSPRNSLEVLYRVEQISSADVQILLQSAVPPDFERLPANYLKDPAQSKPIPPMADVIRAGRALRFRLRANPTRAIETKSLPDGTKRNGRRVEIRGEDAVIEWLNRKAGQHGFKVLACRVDADAPDPRVINGKVEGKRAGARVTIATTLFDGVLEVVDLKLLGDAVEKGIGRAKSYGQGLLSLAPAVQKEDAI
jgi:CRISPR system Cascade subunit CasE